jgi:hypothetical protein
MKTLIAAVIASAVSFGAFARSAFAPAATAPMAAGDSSVKKTPDHQTTKTTKSTKPHDASKPAKKASAPAASATSLERKPGLDRAFFRSATSAADVATPGAASGVSAAREAERPAALDAAALAVLPGLRTLALPALDAAGQLVAAEAAKGALVRFAAPGAEAKPPGQRSERRRHPVDAATLLPERLPFEIDAAGESGLGLEHRKAFAAGELDDRLRMSFGVSPWPR